MSWRNTSSNFYPGMSGQVSKPSRHACVKSRISTLELTHQDTQMSHSNVDEIETLGKIYSLDIQT